MDEELRVALMQAAIQQKKAGATDEQINQALFRASKGKIINTAQLLPPREGPAPEPQKRGETPGALTTAGLSAADMALFGLGDELVQLVRGEEAAEDFRGRRQRGQEEHPVASFAGGAAGLLGGAGSLAGRAVVRAAPAAGRAAAGLLGGGAARAGAGGTAQAVSRGAGQIAGRTGAGAAIGAAEGGLLGATTAEEGERAGAAAGGAVVGGLLGGGVGALSSLGAARQTIRAPEGGSQRLAEAARQTSLLPGRRPVRAQIDEARRVAREAFQEAEAAGPIAGAADVIRQNPAAREALERIGTEESRKLVRQIRKFEKATEAADETVETGLFDATGQAITRTEAAGPAPKLPDIEFGIVDEIRKALGREADAFKKRLPGARGKVPSQSQVREAEAAVGQLEEILSDVPGFQTAIQQTARAGTIERALADGASLFNRPVADIERVLGGKSLAVSSARRINPPKDPETLLAMRQGMADKLIEQLGRGDQSVSDWVSKLETGTALPRRMRLMLGSDEAFDQFMTAVRQEGQNLTTAKVAQIIAKIGGFALGTSLIGGGLVELL